MHATPEPEVQAADTKSCLNATRKLERFSPGLSLKNCHQNHMINYVTRVGRVTLKMYSDTYYLLKNIVSKPIQVSPYQSNVT